MSDRSIMLYTGAIVSMQVDIEGAVVSGTGGDVEMLDAADGSFAGDDSYEATAFLSGSVGAVPLEDIFWNTAYPTTGFTLGATDPLVAPPTIDPGSVNQIWIRTPGGGDAFGRIDDFRVVGGDPPPVPRLGVTGLIALASGLGVSGLRALRR